MGARMIVNLAFAVLSLPVLAWTTYLAILALLSRSNPVPAFAGPPRMSFDVIVPAHDEELGIAATVQNLITLDYPPPLRRVIVVADNCKDATAARASQAGAIVIERNEPALRGKGYALAYAFECSLADRVADALVVVDADTKVTSNLLQAFAARLAGGASAAQAEYRVANPTASWRTRLMHIAFTLFHDVRSRARERLGASAGLRGNGMAFAASLLREVPHDSFSVVEDVEYGIRLGLAGHRVHYVGEAHVLGEMVATEAGSRSQRRRWEGGRWLLARRHAWDLIVRGLQRRSVVILDLAADLLVPPLTYVAFALIAGLTTSAAWFAFGHGAWWAFAPWCVGLLGFGIYLARGVWLARVGARAALDLLWAPIYMMWKIALALSGSKSRQREWVRTARPGEKP
jgi:cellulose synthase/poly-beta-1,6-N-acetylglucosamine synthase-like glycosyltransferase